MGGKFFILSCADFIKVSSDILILRLSILFMYPYNCSDILREAIFWFVENIFIGHLSCLSVQTEWFRCDRLCLQPECLSVWPFEFESSCCLNIYVFNQYEYEDH